MMRISPDLLGQTVFESVASYARMAGRLVAPEAYVQSETAGALHRSTGFRVSIELPIRTLLYEWNVERESLKGLSNFRIDMAAYESVFSKDQIGLKSLIEFKLWTDRNHARNDIERLKKIIRAVRCHKNQSSDIGGYLVVCPQYYQGIGMVTRALKDFRDRFPLCYEKVEIVVPSNGVAYGVGVVVIDVTQYIDGIHG